MVEDCKKLTRRKGMMLSLAIACNRRGAPVRLCRPAPQVEKKEPMTMTQGEGQANVPTTRFLLTPSPYLQEPGSDHAPYKEPPKPWLGLPSVRVGRGQEGQPQGPELWPSAEASPPAPILPAQTQSDVSILLEAKVLVGLTHH